MGGRSKSEGTHTYNWFNFIVQPKLTKYCKATISQFLKKILTEEICPTHVSDKSLELEIKRILKAQEKENGQKAWTLPNGK